MGQKDTGAWAHPVERLATTAVGASDDAVTGRRVAGPVQGFGQMWQKTFRVRLDGTGHEGPGHGDLEGAVPDLLAAKRAVLRAAGRDRPGRGSTPRSRHCQAHRSGSPPA